MQFCRVWVFPKYAIILVISRWTFYISRIRPQDHQLVCKFQTLVVYSRWGRTRILYSVTIFLASLDIIFLPIQSLAFHDLQMALWMCCSHEMYPSFSPLGTVKFIFMENIITKEILYAWSRFNVYYLVFIIFHVETKNVVIVSFV